MFTGSEYSPIRIVSPGEFDRATAQTPGSLRLAAVAPQLGVQSAMWGGLFEVEPARAFIITESSRRSLMSCLASAKSAAARAANTLHAQRPATSFHVPAFLPHMEINPSGSEPFRWVVVGSTSTPIVVNLPNQTWP